MEKTFSELIIKGNFTLVKGFLLGYLCGTASDAKYFFHKKKGIIRRDTLMGMMKGFLEFEERVYLCLEDSACEGFRKAVETAEEKIGISTGECKKIKGAEFLFSFEVYSKELAEECKGIFAGPSESIEFSGFETFEKVNEKISPIGYHSEKHSYRYGGKGAAKGDFYGIVELFMMFKRSKCSKFIECDEVVLEYA